MILNVPNTLTHYSPMTMPPILFPQPFAFLNQAFALFILLLPLLNYLFSMLPIVLPPTFIALLLNANYESQPYLYLYNIALVPVVNPLMNKTFMFTQSSLLKHIPF